MLVRMRLKNAQKVPMRKMPLGNHWVEMEWQEFDIEPKLLELKEAKTWFEIESVEKPKKTRKKKAKPVAEVKPVTLGEMALEDEDEIIEG